jgi:hypothetical protein
VYYALCKPYPTTAFSGKSNHVERVTITIQTMFGLGVKYGEIKEVCFFTERSQREINNNIFTLF